jgi:hypothetical protein
MYIRSEDKFDVFLSHSHIDAAWVEELAERLEDEAKLQVWLDKWILIPGEHWQQAMARGLDQAKSCAVCIGDQTPKGWFREEIERALNRQTKDNSFRVIPILLPNAKTINVEDFLELRTWVDFRNGAKDNRAFHTLISGIQGVVPGRGLKEESRLHTQYMLNIQRVTGSRQHPGQSINDEIALDYQRRLLDLLSNIKNKNEKRS